MMLQVEVIPIVSIGVALCALYQPLLFTELGWRENSNRAWINLITDGAGVDTINSLYLA